MLGLLCPECSIVKVFTPPPALRSCVCICAFYKTTLNCLEYSLQEKCLGWISCHFLCQKNLYFLYCDVYICIVYIDVPKVHWQTIYCGKFTMEKTRHFTWAMFGQHNTSITSTFIFEAQTES